MAPENQAKACFDPSRDIDKYLIQDSEALRQRGLQRQSIRFYELLCRLCLPGESHLVYRQQADLVSDLKRLAPDDKGLTEGSVSRKLNRLTLLGFASKFGGGQSNCMLIIELFLPDLVDVKPPRPRKPTVTATPDGERQGQFFGSGGQFRVVGGDEDPPKAQTLALSKAQSLSVSPPESASVCAFEPASAEERTSYPRTRGRTPAVDVVDDDEVVSTVEVLEVHEARSALKRAIVAWRQARIPKPKWGPNRSHLSTWLKTHTLMLRGKIPAAAYGQGLTAVTSTHDSSGIRESVWAILWRTWSNEIPKYGPTLRALELPSGWYEIMSGQPPSQRAAAEDEPSQEERERLRCEFAASAKEAIKPTQFGRRPESAPNGEQPQRK